MGEIKVGVIIRSLPLTLTLSLQGEGELFIPPASWGYSGIFL